MGTAFKNMKCTSTIKKKKIEEQAGSELGQAPSALGLGLTEVVLGSDGLFFGLGIGSKSVMLLGTNLNLQLFD